MDDGFQNPTLQKDFSIIVVNSEQGFGNKRVIPSGPLRESINRGLSRTNLVITIGANDIYSGNTTQGSTNFELHPSEENSLIMSILGLTGVTIKDQGLVTLTSRALQSQAQLKSQ